MADSQGTISYLADVDTSGVLKAEKTIDKSTKNVENSFKSIDTQVKKSSKDVNKALGNVGRVAGQAGIQMQQFIGQIQGGVSPMVALSQQGADLGIVLGAPLLGAIIGISSSFASMLLPALFNSKDGAEKLEKALESLKGISYETSDGTLALSASIEKLAKKSESAAKIELANGIIKAKEALKIATEEVDKNTRAWEGWFSTNASNLPNAIKELDVLSKTMERTGKSATELFADDDFTSYAIPALSNAVEELGEQYGVTQTQALGLVKVFKQYENAKTPENIKAVATALNAVALSADKPNKKLLELAKKMNEAALSAGNASELIKLAQSALKDFDSALNENSESSSKNKDSVDSLIDSLLAESNALSMTQEQQLLLTAASKGATAADLEQISAIYKKIDAYKAEDEASKQRGKDEGFAKGVTARGMTESEKLAEEHEKLLELKQKYNEDSLIFDEALTANEKRQGEIRTKNKEDEETKKTKAESDARAATLNGLMTLTGAITDSADEQSSAYKVAFAIQKAAAIAQIIIASELAAAQVLAHDAGILGLGAAATATAIRGIGYASAAVVAGTAIAGGRQYGGPTTKGSNYRINETGTPEIYSEGGKDYLMNSGGGKVTPMDKVDSGGEGWNIIVNNNASGATVLEPDINSETRTVKLTIDEINRQVNNKSGSFVNTMRANSNFKTK